VSSPPSQGICRH